MVPGVMPFGFMLGGSVWFGLTQGVPETRIYWLAIVPPCFSAFFLLSVWAAIYSVRHRLHVYDDRIVHIGIRKSTELQFAEIVNAKWHVHSRGIALKGGKRRINISFGEYERSTELPLIRFLRKSIPLQAQQNWERFCLAIALPMRQPKTVPGPGEILLTRRRYDWFGGILMVASIGAILISHALTKRPTLLLGIPVSVIFAGFFWLALRYSVPAGGLVVEHTPGMGMFTFLTGSSMVMFLAFIFGKDLNVPYVQMCAGVGMVLVFGATIVHCRYYANAREKRDKVLAEQAAVEWERLELDESGAVDGMPAN